MTSSSSSCLLGDTALPGGDQEMLRRERWLLALRGTLPWKPPPYIDLFSPQAELPGADGLACGELLSQPPFKPYACLHAASSLKLGGSQTLT